MPQEMDSFSILKTKLQLILPSLPRSEKAAATYLIENLHRIGSLNLNTISAEIDASSATIIPCQLISLKLMKIGKACVVLNDQDMQVFCASSMRFGDVALAVSHTGRSKSVVEAMRIARERGAITIGVTAAAKSPLLKHCSYALLTGTVDDTTAGDIISRRIAEQTVLETLYLCTVDNNEKDIEEVKKQGAKVIEQMTKLSNEDSEVKV